MSTIIPNEALTVPVPLQAFPKEECNRPLTVRAVSRETVPLVKCEEEEMTNNLNNGAAVPPMADLLVLPGESTTNTIRPSPPPFKHEHCGPESTPECQQKLSDREESSPSSNSSAYPNPSASHPPPPPPPHGQHPSHSAAHQSYAQYYQHYPHGHAHYYYPHGAYYPPPPHHASHSAHSAHASGHQPAYPHNPHHAHPGYYAHYPPPGYYPPPHHYYYPQPHASSPEYAGTGSEGTKRSTPPPSQSRNSPPPATATTTTSSPPANSKPYSAFSSSPKAPATASTHDVHSHANATTPVKSSASPPTMPKSKSTKTLMPPPPPSNRSKRKTPDSTTIFRSNEKRTKINSSTRAAAAAIAARRAEVKEKAKQQLPKTVLDRRSRKNAQSRLRAAKLKQRISDIRAKDPRDRAPEEAKTLAVFEERRQRKNGRSRERALERKREYERTMSLPETKWSEEQKNFVQETMVAKFKKNEGDRMRRKKLKDGFEGSTTGSVSSEWATSTCGASFDSSGKKVSIKSGIPDYIESTNVQYDPPASQSQISSREAPCTPVSQREVNSLLESTPTNFFGVYSPVRNRADCFSPNLIFPSPSRNHRDLSASMDSIDFDSLELPIDGTSILDSSMAINIDDEVMYSPNLKTPTINNANESDHHSLLPSGEHAIPNLTSKIVLSPLSLRKRSRPTLLSTPRNDHDVEFESASAACDFHDISFPEDFSGSRPNGDSKAIAVSFSTDTA